MKSFLIIVVGVALGVGISLRIRASEQSVPRKPDQSATSQPTTNQGKPDVVKVTTAQEFIDAIGPNRVIQLAAGEYVLTDVKDRWMEFIRWDRKFDGKSLTIRNVENLSIVGLGEKPVRVIVRPGYVFVLNFEKCQGVKLSNLSLGHAPEKGECDSGVIGASDCTDLSFLKCDLFGCGTEGLTLKNVKKLQFDDSTIRECTAGIMTLDGCSDVAFTRSRFAGNEQYAGIQIDDSKDVLFTECTVENNTGTGPIFQTTSTSRVRFEGGAIRGNLALSLMDPPDGVKMRGATVEDNRFGKRP